MKYFLILPIDKVPQRLYSNHYSYSYSVAVLKYITKKFYS